MDLYVTVESLFKYICDSFAGKECKTQEVVLVSVEFLKGQSAPARINGPTSTQAKNFSRMEYFSRALRKIVQTD